MFAEDQNYIINTYQRLPIHITHAEGVYLYDDQGERYLDMFSGIAVNALGHQHPKINQVLTEQASKFLHLSNVFASQSVVDLAKKLVDTSFASKVFFANSGTEANEAALKLARKWGRSIKESKTDIIALNQGFHGRSSGGMALTGKDTYKLQFAPLLPGISHIKLNDIDALEAAIHDDVCAIFLEIIQGEGGIQLIDALFLEKLVALSQKHQVLIVVDEIQTGLMRTGKLYAYEHYDFQPDIVTLAKALGGGLPLGAMLVNEKLEKVFTYGDHGSTFGGNPLACALGNVIMDEITDKNFASLAQENMAYLIKELYNIQKDFPHIIKDVRGLGYMLGLEVGKLAPIYKERMLEKKVLINVTNQSVIRLLPALTINKDDIDLFIKQFKETTQSIHEEGY